MSTKLSVAETFYSIQGEGSTMGYPAVFVRLAGCNLMCGGQGTQFDQELHNGATWRCDTIEVWMKGRSKPYDEILSEESIQALKDGAHLIITGGEPTMQQKSLISFFEYLEENVSKNIVIECETNGTIIPKELAEKVYLFNCSPKLSNSGNEKSLRHNSEVIKFLNQRNTIFKFVISRPEDWDEIQEDYLPFIDKHKVWLMPAGANEKLLNENKLTVVELCKKHRLKYSTRLQIDIWNQATGV